MTINEQLNWTIFGAIHKALKDICDDHYKHVTIVNDDSSGIIKWSFKLIDAARGVIYDCHMFIVHATGPSALRQIA